MLWHRGIEQEISHVHWLGKTGRKRRGTREREKERGKVSDV